MHTHTTPTTPTRPPAVRSGLFPVRHLDHEWASLSSSRDARTALRRWTTTDPALFTDLSVDDVIGVVRDAAADADPWLTALLTHAAGGDRFATRTILQAVIPYVVVPLCRARVSRDPDDGWDVVSVVAEQITTFPLDRCHTGLLAGLYWRSRRALYRGDRRTRRDRDVLVPLDTHTAERLPARTGPRTRFEELTVTVTDAVTEHVLTVERAELLLAVASGRKMCDLATEAGLDPSTISKQVTAGTTRLRDAIAERDLAA